MKKIILSVVLLIAVVLAWLYFHGKKENPMDAKNFEMVQVKKILIIPILKLGNILLD